MVLPLPPLIQTPLMAKHPPDKLIPLANVEEAPVLVMFSTLADNPPAKVEVPWPAATVIAPPKVEVAVEVATKLPTNNKPFAVVDAKTDEEVLVIVPIIELPEIKLDDWINPAAEIAVDEA